MTQRFAVVGTILFLGVLGAAPIAQADQVRHHRRLHEGRSVDVRPQAYFGWNHASPVRPGPPGSGLCNTIQIAAGNCHYPSH